RTLRQLKASDLQLLREEYPNLENDFKVIGRYLNRKNLEELVKSNGAWQQVKEDVAAAEEMLDLHLGPHSDDERAHQNLTAKVLAAQEDRNALTKLIN